MTWNEGSWESSSTLSQSRGELGRGDSTKAVVTHGKASVGSPRVGLRNVLVPRANRADQKRARTSTLVGGIGASRGNARGKPGRS
jgi:hypothetical protein